MIAKESIRNYTTMKAMNPDPDGWFLVLNHIPSEFRIYAMDADLHVNKKTSIDISVGLTWSKWWDEQHLGDEFGSTTKFKYRHPPGYPQAAMPIRCNAYPDCALPEFRRWFDQIYVKENFPNYVFGKAERGDIPFSQIADKIEICHGYKGGTK